MVSVEVLIMISAIVLCIGMLLGAIISRSVFPPEHEKELEKRLQTSRDELNRYQQDVAQHFAETSRLVTNLTHNYKEVHEHLAKGAIQLTSPEISKEMLEAGHKIGIEANDLVDHADIAPPKDWAPKEPGQTGTLSEEFGLKEDPEDAPIQPIGAKVANNK